MGALRDIIYCYLLFRSTECMVLTAWFSIVVFCVWSARCRCMVRGRPGVGCSSSSRTAAAVRCLFDCPCASRSVMWMQSLCVFG